MTKEWRCIGIKVIGRTAVVAEMKLSVLEEGQVIAWKVHSDMYNRHSDWSEADPLVQGVCKLVFAEYLKPEQSQCAHCGQSFDQAGRKKKYCGPVCKKAAEGQRRWQRIKSDPEKLERHRQVNRDYVKRNRADDGEE